MGRLEGRTVIDPAATAAALRSAEARVKVIEARAVALAGTPSEFDVLLIAEHARRITNNLRRLLATTESRNA
jgi:hypothetical protein